MSAQPSTAQNQCASNTSNEYTSRMDKQLSSVQKAPPDPDACSRTSAPDSTAHVACRRADGTPCPPVSLTLASTQPNDSDLLWLKGTCMNVPATFLVDSGAECNFVCQSFLHQHGVHSPDKSSQRNVHMADGSSVTSYSMPNTSVCVDQYCDTIPAQVVPSLHGFDCILGKPWLNRYGNNINWRTRCVTFEHHGRTHCLRTPSSHKPAMQLPCRPATSIVQPTSSNQQQPVQADAQQQCHERVHVQSAPVLLGYAGFKKCLNKNHEIYLFSVRPVQQQENQSMPDDQPQPAPLCDVSGIVGKYEHLFAEPTGLPPKRPGIDLHIETDPAAPYPNRQPNRMAKHELDFLREHLQALQDKGHIRPSTSPYGSAVLCVKKPDGSLRLVCDYRALNRISKRQGYSMPRIEDTLDRLHKAKVFSVLDCNQAYYLVRTEDDSVQKTAFRTRYGSFEWLVMPMGVSGAPGVFQKLMNTIFADMMDECVCAFQDDVIVFSETPEQHLQHLDKVMARLDQHQLKLKRAKCRFALPVVKFLGFIVSAQGVACDPEKIKAIQDWPVPKSKSDVLAFLGLCGFYRKFVHHFAHKAAPLHALTGKQPFVWSNDQQQAYEQLKSALCTPPILALPDPGKQFRLFTDASEFAIGAVLTQGEGKDERVVAFESRKLNPHEVRYPNHERELLAVVHALRKWRHYLLCAAHPVALLSDNTPVVHILSKKDLLGREAHWSELLAEYNLDPKHIQGKKNIVADALSRRPDHALMSMLTSHVSVTPSRRQTALLEEVRKQAQQDAEYCDILLKVQSGQQRVNQCSFVLNEGVLYQGKFQRLYVPMGQLRRMLMHEAHDAVTAGHVGKNKMLARLQEHFYWPDMPLSVREYCRTCPSCQKNKSSNQKPLGLMQPLPIPEHNWQQVSMDFITQLPVTASGHDAIVVFVDRLSKMIIAQPTFTSASAQDTARLFFDHVFCKHGMPRVIVSDRDSKFTSEFWRALFKLCGTRLAMSSANHPQTDGQTERANRTLEDMIRAYISPFHNDWDQYLQPMSFAYNSSEQASTGYTPFFLNYGHNPPAPLDLLMPTTAMKDNDATAFAKRVQDNLSHAKECLKQAQQRQATAYDKKHRPGTFQVGDRVLVSINHFSNLPEISESSVRKFSPRYYGPFPVLDVISPVAYRLDLPTAFKRVHPVIHISKLKLYLDASDKYPDRQDKPVPPPDFIDGERHDFVESFRDVRGHRILVKFADEETPIWRPTSALKEDLSPDIFEKLMLDYKQQRTERQQQLKLSKRSKHSKR